MTQTILIGVDLLAISLLTFGLYFPRHRRRDLVVAFLGVNVGVLAVAIMLGSSTIGAGLGLGLFGVLSIIRLRSDEIAQHEVAYYFAALALGLITGLSTEVTPLQLGLMALIILVLFVGDHPALFRGYRQQTLMIDAAFTNEDDLKDHLGVLLGARIHSVQVRELNCVNDTTVVDVRFQAASGRGGRTRERFGEPRTTPAAAQPNAQPTPQQVTR